MELDFTNTSGTDQGRNGSSSLNFNTAPATSALILRLPKESQTTLVFGDCLGQSGVEEDEVDECLQH